MFIAEVQTLLFQILAHYLHTLNAYSLMFVCPENGRFLERERRRAVDLSLEMLQRLHQRAYEELYDTQTRLEGLGQDVPAEMVICSYSVVAVAVSQLFVFTSCSNGAQCYVARAERQ